MAPTILRREKNRLCEAASTNNTTAAAGCWGGEARLGDNSELPKIHTSNRAKIGILKYYLAVSTHGPTSVGDERTPHTHGYTQLCTHAPTTEGKEVFLCACACVCGRVLTCIGPLTILCSLEWFWAKKQKQQQVARATDYISYPHHVVLLVSRRS